MKREGQCEKSQFMSTTELYFTLSVVCLVVECTKRQRITVTKNKDSDSCRPAGLEIDREVCSTATTS